MDFEDAETNGENTTKKAHCDRQPIPYRLLGAIDPTAATEPCLSEVRLDQSQQNHEYSEGKENERLLGHCNGIPFRL
jgi:hypothetical protein